MAKLNFNANEHDTMDVMDPVPPGWYNAIIDDSEIKPTRNGTGSYLMLRFSLMGGTYNNRKIFLNLNLWHANPQAQEIAQKQMSTICHAIGVMQVNDSQELHGKPLSIRVKINPATDQYDASNSITAFKSVEDMTPASSTPPWASSGKSKADSAPKPWDSAPPKAEKKQETQEQQPAKPVEKQQSGLTPPPWMDDIPSEGSSNPPWAE